MEKIKKNMKIGICLSLVSCVIAFFCIITEMKSFYDVYVALFEFEQSGDSYITTSLIMLFIVMCVCLLAILIATGYLCFSFNKINSVEISSDNRKQLKRHIIVGQALGIGLLCYGFRTNYVILLFGVTLFILYTDCKCLLQKIEQEEKIVSE